MLTDKDLEELRNERHADYVAEATPKPLPDGYDLCEYLLHGIIANDACPYSYIGNQSISVKALQFTQSKHPAIHLELSGGGFDVTSQLTPDTARAIGAALFAAAVIIEDFEAAECIAQERELARFNAGPISLGGSFQVTGARA